MPQVSKYTNKSGARRLNSLFLEQQTASGKDGAAVYTLKEYDYSYRGKTYPSLRRLYLEACDPTEYNFANTHLADYTHWQALCDAEFFKPYVAEWRVELDVKLRAMALAGMIRDAQSEGREAQAARKYLLDSGWGNKLPKATRGRPSKDEIKKAAHEQAKDATTVKEMYARLIEPKLPSIQDTKN